MPLLQWLMVIGETIPTIGCCLIPWQLGPRSSRPSCARLQYGAPLDLWLLVPRDSRPRQSTTRRLSWSAYSGTAITRPHQVFSPPGQPWQPLSRHLTWLAPHVPHIPHVPHVTVRAIADLMSTCPWQPYHKDICVPPYCPDSLPYVYYMV